MQKYIIGNWKMSISRREVSGFLLKFTTLNKNANIQFGISAPFVFIDELSNSFTNKNTWIGAQNVSEYERGAYTGEISASMLADSNVNFCLVGHSERRHIFNETKEQTNIKIFRLLENNITPLLCIGETLEEFDNHQTLDVLSEQIKYAFNNLNNDNINKIILAYEPVWAIGTGKTPTIQDIEKTITFIKDYIQTNYNTTLPVLYGGSVNVKNSSEILAIPCVDGALIGGASLDAQNFVDIANNSK